jgi:hypothetical protein
MGGGVKVGAYNAPTAGSLLARSARRQQTTGMKGEDVDGALSVARVLPFLYVWDLASSNLPIATDGSNTYLGSVKK